MGNDELSNLKAQIRLAKLEKAVKKEETIKTFRQAKEKQRAAFSADRNAKAKTERAEKLKKKAELACLSASSARIYANHIHDAANELLKLAEQKYAETKTIAKYLHDAEKAVKNARKLTVKQQKMNDRIGLMSD